MCWPHDAPLIYSRQFKHLSDIIMREQRSTMPEGPEDARSLCILLLSCIKDVKLTQRVLLFVWCRIFNKTIPIQVDITPKTNTLYVLVCCTFNKAFKPLSLLILAFLVILPFSRPLQWLTTLTMMLTTPNKEKRKKLEGAKKKGGECKFGCHLQGSVHMYV